jgi:CubicO group peptidase (beta-lactamase class C family)
MHDDDAFQDPTTPVDAPFNATFDAPVDAPVVRRNGRPRLQLLVGIAAGLLAAACTAKESKPEQPTIAAASGGAHAPGDPARPDGAERDPAAPEASSAEASDPAGTPTVDRAFLARCEAASAYSLAEDGDFMLVLRDGEVLFEAGRAGMTSTTPHLLASGTKSFCGIAAAIAVDDGLLSLDERVSDTIHEWKADPRKAAVTVRQLLSLASGLESLSAKIDNPRSAAANGITDRAKASIEAAFKADPGERFIYGPSSFYVFDELLRRKLAAAGTGDRDIVAYLERKVFAPLEISPQFQRDPVGNPNMAGGGRIGARDWATFGEMVLDGGVARGAADADGSRRRVVGEANLRELLEPHGPNARYGLTWWLLRENDGDPESEVAAGLAADRLASQEAEGPVRGAIRRRLADAARARADAAPTRTVDAPVEGFMAAGKGKQRLYILPGDNLVVVRFGKLEGGRGFSDAEFLRLLLGERGTAPAGTAPRPAQE